MGPPVPSFIGKVHSNDFKDWQYCSEKSQNDGVVKIEIWRVKHYFLLHTGDLDDISC